MEAKEYQIRALEQVKQYLTYLADLKRKNDKAVAEFGPDVASDFPSKAWGKLEGMHRIYTGRRDGIGRCLPCFCLKVPTGGGKTFLAVKAIDLVNRVYLRRQTGLVLWVVPTTQIYRQTLKSLQNRDHPYRQHLDIASGGRTTILEKMESFSPIDIAENLVVMMLMLPSASRRNKDVLRMFKDSGNYLEFFPAEDDAAGNRALLQRVPNLDTFESAHGFWGRQVKTSLGNTLRILNPVLILDEGQKAYSVTAQDTLRGFNPSIIIELSATPPQGSNILVDIKGIELDREEMIKFDLHVINKASMDWKDTLLAAHNHLQTLQDKAREYESNSGNHIRPICLIQAERTGRDQRDGRYIHSEDVREHLIQKFGIPAEEVAVKTSEKDELKEVDDVGGLMSRNCRIRYIITKQALQEGWDCAFAYVLCVLTNPSSVTGMTQLVGRILRLPYAKKTRIKELDESYVFCFQRRGAELLEDIRSGFRGEGLGDLTGRIGMEESGQERDGATERTCEVREKFRTAAERTILPVFAIKQNGHWRRVDHAMDIGGRIPWDEIDPEPIFGVTLSQLEEKDIEHVAGISSDVHEVIRQKEAKRLTHGSIKLDPVFMARQLLDLTPNPWVAYDMSKTILSRFVQQYDTERVTNNFVFLIEETRKLLAVEIDRLSQKVFQEMIGKGTMRFLVIARELGGYSLPTTKKTVRSSRILTKRDGQPLERSLFDPVPEEDFNEPEKEVAWYLEDQGRLLFWYRNIPKKDYAIQGWRKPRIFADFIFTDVGDRDNAYNRVFVVETKGLHLEGNRETVYKRQVFDTCNKEAKRTTMGELGMQLNTPNIEFHVIDEDEWKNRLNALFETTVAGG